MVVVIVAVVPVLSDESEIAIVVLYKTVLVCTVAVFVIRFFFFFGRICDWLKIII